MNFTGPSLFELRRRARLALPDAAATSIGTATVWQQHAYRRYRGTHGHGCTRQRIHRKAATGSSGAAQGFRRSRRQHAHARRPRWRHRATGTAGRAALHRAPPTSQSSALARWCQHLRQWSAPSVLELRKECRHRSAPRLCRCRRRSPQYAARPARRRQVARCIGATGTPNGAPGGERSFDARRYLCALLPVRSGMTALQADHAGQFLYRWTCAQTILQSPMQRQQATIGRRQAPAAGSSQLLACVPMGQRVIM